MKWIELSIATDAEGAEAAASLLNEHVSGGAGHRRNGDPQSQARPGSGADLYRPRLFSSDLEGLEERVERGRSGTVAPVATALNGAAAAAHGGRRRLGRDLEKALYDPPHRPAYCNQALVAGV